MRPGRASLGWLLAILAGACAATVVVPVFLIRPFTPQTPAGLVTAWTLRSWAPALCLAGLLLGLATAALLWPRLRTWKGRVPAVLAVILLAACAWAARVNLFERMFRPIDRPAFARAMDTSHVKDDELVLGIHAGGVARAYRVRALAYHHVVNDEVHGEPVVATY